MSRFDDQSANLIGGFTAQSDREFKDSVISVHEAMKIQHGTDVALKFTDVITDDITFESYSNLLFGDSIATEATCESSFSNASVGGIDDGYYSMHGDKMRQMVENSRAALLEASSVAQLSPVVSLTFPILKKHYIKQAYKDVIQTVVSDGLVVKLATEREFVRNQAGDKKYFVPDIFYPENEAKLREINQGALGKPMPADFFPKEAGAKLPLVDFNVLEAAGGSLASADALGYDFGIIAVKMLVPTGDGTTTEEIEINGLDIKPNIQTHNFAQRISAKSKATGKTNEIVTDTIMGMIDPYSGIININAGARITKVKFGGHLSSQNNDVGLTIDRVREVFDITIPEQERINTGITAEMIKDEKIMSNIDVMSDRVSRLATYCQNTSDSRTKFFLDDEFVNAQAMDAMGSGGPLGYSCKFTESVSFPLKAPERFTAPESEWRTKQLKFYLERLVLNIVQRLRTDDVMLTIVANPTMLSYLDDVKWVVDENTKIGGIKLDYKFGITTIAGVRIRVVSTQKETENKGFRIILNTLSDDLITWRKYEYSFIVENNYRNQITPLTPNVMVAQRYLNYKYLPVQAEFYFQEFRNEGYKGLTPLY